MRADIRARLVLAAAIVPAAHANAQPGTLTLGVRAEGESGIVSNPRFAQSTDSNDVMSRARVGASLVRRSTRGSIGVSTDGEAQRFRATPDLSRFTYGGTAMADQRFTERLALTGSVSARTSLSRDAIAGADPASVAVSAPLPLLPLTLSHAYSAGARASYRASPRTTVTSDIGFDRVSYATAGLASGTSVRSEFGLVRALPDATVVSAVLDAHRAETDGQLLTTNALEFGIDTRLVGPIRAQLLAGAAVLGTSQQATLLRPIGSAVLGAPALGGAWSVQYARDVTPLLGVGAIVASDRAGASYAHVAPGGMLVRVGTEQAWSRIGALNVPRTVTNASYADVRRPIIGGLWVGMGAARRSRTQDPTVRSQNVSLTTGYVGAW